MHINDKFYHAIQFHPALSLQNVALPSPFFHFSTMAVFSLLSRLAGKSMFCFQRTGQNCDGSVH